MRFIALVLAYFFLVLAIVGIFVPGLPTVPFLLLTAWFSAKGSERLHRWLYTHPQLGKLLIDWEKHGMVSRTSKLMAILMLAVSWLLMFQRVSNIWILIGVSALFIGVSVFLLTRPESRQ